MSVLGEWQPSRRMLLVCEAALCHSPSLIDVQPLAQLALLGKNRLQGCFLTALSVEETMSSEWQRQQYLAAISCGQSHTLLCCGALSSLSSSRPPEQQCCCTTINCSLLDTKQCLQAHGTEQANVHALPGGDSRDSLPE